jgi:branched-chain amino acid transport system substrate-binding protein
MWRTAPSNAIEAKALRLEMGALETLVRQQSGAAQVKLAVAVKGDPFGTGLWALTKDGLSINGAPVGDPSNASILVRQYSASPTTAELAAIASAISDFAPQIVFSVGTAEAIGGILSPVEATWSVRHPSQSPPQWLFSDGGQTSQVLDAVTKGDLRTRVRGTVPGSRGRLYDTFLARYGEVYPAGPPVTFGSAGAYDIVYLLAYAALAAPSDPEGGPAAPLTGARLANGLVRAVTGDASTSRIEVGPNGLNPGFQRLAEGGAIKFTGASGSLDFDVSVGEAPSDIDVWCVTQSGAPGFRSSGIYYSADSDSLIGTYACP